MAQFRNWWGGVRTPAGGEGSNPFDQLWLDAGDSRNPEGVSGYYYEGNGGQWFKPDSWASKDLSKREGRREAQQSAARQKELLGEIKAGRQERRTDERDRFERTHGLERDQLDAQVTSITGQLENQAEEIRQIALNQRENNEIKRDELGLKGTIAEQQLALSNRQLGDALTLGKGELALKRDQMDLNTQATNIEIGQKQKLMGMNMLNSGFANAISALQGRLG